MQSHNITVCSLNTKFTYISWAKQSLYLNSFIMAQRIPRKKSYTEEIDEFSDESENDNVGQKFITVHRSVTHIGVINGPVVIGPQFNNTHNPMQPSTWYNQPAHPFDEYKNDIEEHFNRCINEKRYIETNEIKAIADKITNNQLPKLCHNLGIAEERLQVILCQKHSFLHQLFQNVTTYSL